MRTISRAQFLRGDWGREQSIVRPPWSLPEGRFTVTCDGCGDCVDACPQNILKINGRRLAEVDFSRNACTFCGDCATTCSPGAIAGPGNNAKLPWQLIAGISPDCLAIKGTSCLRCLESCPTEAIVARPALRGKTSMEISAAACNGCGACVSDCPVGAIFVPAPRLSAGNNRSSTGEHDESFVHQ